MAKQEYQLEKLDEKGSIILNYMAGYKYKILDMDLKEQPELKIIDGDKGNIISIRGLSELKKFRKLLCEFIETTEENFQ